MPITGELAFRFAGYWSVVVHRRPQRPEIKRYTLFGEHERGVITLNADTIVNAAGSIDPPVSLREPSPLLRRGDKSEHEKIAIPPMK